MIITGKYPNLRLRRSRKYDWSRRLVEENTLSNNDLILPIFLVEGTKKKIPIKTMSGVFRYSIDKLDPIINDAIKRKIPMIAIFPYINKSLKNKKGSEALNENNLVCRAVRYIKNKFKNNIGIMCDVALDPYTSHGHDGIILDDEIKNDETIEILIKQSILQAEMGCDVIAPSDMMDGRIKLIRNALDRNNHKDVQLLSYAAKYASSFYGPFRDAVGSNKSLKGNKKTYQMDYKNQNEAIREVALDIKEGADMVMIKPALPYLDIISLVKKEFKIPVFAYQVSGEYSLIKNAIDKKLIDKKAIIEILMSYKRSGASAIVTYFANQI